MDAKQASQFNKESWTSHPPLLMLYDQNYADVRSSIFIALSGHLVTQRPHP